MPISDSVQVVVEILHYVLPATFVWCFAHVIVSAVIKAATGKTERCGL